MNNKHLPRLSNCPYCGEDNESEQRVEIVDVTKSAQVFTEEPSYPVDDSYDTTEGLKFHPCKHAFKLDDVVELASLTSDLWHLKKELYTSTDADRIRELKEYEIPAKVNEINHYDCERLERAE